MTALSTLTALTEHFSLETRQDHFTTDVLVPGYTQQEPDGDVDFPAEHRASIWSDDDGNVRCIIVGDRRQPSTAIAQLGLFIKLVEETAYYWGDYDLTGLKLVYRKRGNLVDVDIVSTRHNWWNYEKDGVKYQALFATEHHEGPDIITVEARLVYDPVCDLLMAR